VKYDGGLLKHH